MEVNTSTQRVVKLNVYTEKQLQKTHLLQQSSQQEGSGLFFRREAQPEEHQSAFLSTCVYLLRKEFPNALSFLKGLLGSTTRALPGDDALVSHHAAGAGADGWLAAQCSAHGGDQHHRVIQRLIAQLCDADQQEDQQEDPDPPLDAQLVVPLLSFLSSQTTLVRSLLAEQLNSTEWRTRLMSCNTLCCLKGPINKDVVHKLLHLMLNDHSNPVRHAAAETLMKLGRIQQVHTELRGRMEALDVICHLKIKTETLLEPVIRCLSDEFTALRKQACLTAASMQLREESVVSCLLQLVEHDAAPEVRLSAIRAVGALGLSSPDVQEALMSCVETEREAELRAEACRMLQSSGVSSDQLQGFLLQRVDLECNPLVQRVITEKLELLEKLTAEGESLKPRMLVRLLSQQYVIEHKKAD
ncbi:hypothetical protein F7725_008624 [Dissostichus mawsoni]|uniref:Uncharacterized protein n=2 Tax=Dissostichus mawsoni TaxID=36200 RepID=A0A7J5Y928_DISMA|nr:hypothetical protein F7725_008624 [Dissostichus mawsoni]